MRGQQIGCGQLLGHGDLARLDVRCHFIGRQSNFILAVLHRRPVAHGVAHDNRLHPHREGNSCFRLRGNFQRPYNLSVVFRAVLRDGIFHQLGSFGDCIGDRHGLCHVGRIAARHGVHQRIPGPHRAAIQVVSRFIRHGLGRRVYRHIHRLDGVVSVDVRKLNILRVFFRQIVLHFFGILVQIDATQKVIAACQRGICHCSALSQRYFAFRFGLGRPVAFARYVVGYRLPNVRRPVHRNGLQGKIDPLPLCGKGRVIVVGVGSSRSQQTVCQGGFAVPTLRGLPAKEAVALLLRFGLHGVTLAVVLGFGKAVLRAVQRSAVQIVGHGSLPARIIRKNGRLRCYGFVVAIAAQNAAAVVVYRNILQGCAALQCRHAVRVGFGVQQPIRKAVGLHGGAVPGIR